jgi:hypothetical protein
MKIEIHTHDRRLVSDLLGSSTITVNDKVQISGDAVLRFDGIYIRKAVGFPEIVYFSLTFGLGVSASLVANWLYNKLRKKKIEKLIIDRRVIEIDEGEIKKIIEERLKIE